MNTRGLFFKLFPPPHYLKMSGVGLDISDQSIKFVELGQKNGKLSLLRQDSIAIPEGVIVEGRIMEPKKLISTLTQFRERNNLKNVIVALPEEQAFVVRMELPNVSLGELRSSIEYQIEEYVPFKSKDIVFDYEIISHPNKESNLYHVSVSVLPLVMVQSYFEALKQAGFDPLAFEIEGQALSRALIPWQEKGLVMIVDIGRTRAGFALVFDGRVTFTSTVSKIGGEDVTRSIAKTLNINREEAEKLKTQKGLLRSKENEPVFYSLIPVISSLADEIKRVREYWKNHKDLHQRSVVDRLILTGGQSTLPGLDSYLATNLGVPVTLGNPWLNFISFDEEIPAINLNDAERYATAIGLALRSEYHLIYG